jgi:hypothetical protein
VIIDSHVHLKHGDRAKTEYSPEIIVRTMDAVGIDQSVVFAMSTTTARSIEMAREAVGRYPDRLIPYAYALPHYQRPVIPELEEAIVQQGFRGIKIHVGECTLASYVIDPVIALAGQHGVPCLIDCSGRDDAIRRLAEAHPETKLLVAHLGKYLSTDAELVDRFLDLAVLYPNVLLDVSGVVLLHKIEEAVARVGAERIFFGTDGPHEKPDTIAFAEAELEKIRRLSLPPEAKGAILAGNIIRLLGL